MKFSKTKGYFFIFLKKQVKIPGKLMVSLRICRYSPMAVNVLMLCKSQKSHSKTLLCDDSVLLTSKQIRLQKRIQTHPETKAN